MPRVQTDRHMDDDMRPTGVLVLRLWADGDAPDDLRARVRSTSNVVVDAGRSQVLAGRSPIIAYVVGWVDEYRRLANQSDGEHTGHTNAP